MPLTLLIEGDQSMDFTVALLQIKPKLGRVADNLALIQEQVEQAIAQKADLAVLPELALTGYFLKRSGARGLP